MNDKKSFNAARIIILQKLYSYQLNKDVKLNFPKHKYKKFIKDVVLGTIERQDLIQDLMDKELKKDINENKTSIIAKLIIMSAIYEFMFMHKVPIKVIINEYLKVSEFFVESAQKKFLNAILDKISKKSRISNQ